MIRLRRIQGCLHVAVGAACLLLPAAPAARADTVWSVARTPNGKPYAAKVKIDGLSSAGLMYRTMSQDRVADPKPLKDIWRIEVDNEKTLNSAEDAFTAQKWNDAVAGYQAAVNTTGKDWVKQYAALRLIAAAEKSGKFSAAAAAYAALVQRDVKSAATAKPEVPKNSKAELPLAISSVKASLTDAKLQPSQKAALQAFLAELYIANGQLKDAQAIGASVAASPAGAAPAPTRALGGTAAPAAAAAPADKGQTDLKLQLAMASLKDKKYQEAIDAIEAIAPSLNDPEQQADALFCLAEAKAGTAGEDPTKLKDAALAYMFVVAHFKSQPDAPHVAEALLRTGVVLEQARLFPDALAAYQAVQGEYKDSPHAKEAAAGVARVQKAIQEAKG